MSAADPSPPPAAAPPPAVPPRKMFGLPPWLLALCLFAAGGIIAWQGGLLHAIITHFRGERWEEPTKELMDINTATEEELRTLPDVDEKLAEQIIKKRPFATIDDLKEVKGIGDKKLAKLRPLVRVK